MIFSNMSVFWLVAMIVLLIIEAMIPGLVSIWFALGSLIALIAAALHAPVWLQFALFGVTSFVTLILTRPLAQKYINSKVQPTNADMIIGKECVVKERIDNISGTGAILEGGKIWTARSYDDNVTIEENSRAFIERIEGVKAIVKPVTDTNQS